MNITSAQRMNFFDGLASGWDEEDDYRQKQNRLKKIIRSLDINPGDKILDLGTGTGITLQPLADAVTDPMNVYGLDISWQMLKQSKEKHRLLVRGDCHSLPFGRNTFDVIFAFAVIPHIDDVNSLMHQVSNLLHKNGLFVILHLMSREIINDFHRKTGTAVENDMLPSREQLNKMGLRYGLQPAHFQENDNLFLWTATKIID